MNLEDVADACEAIEKQGRRYTVRAIREHLGGGSPGDIARHLREIRGQETGQAEVARLRRELAAEKAEVARLQTELARLGTWALSTVRERAATLEADGRLLFSIPPQEPRLVTVEKQVPPGWALKDGVLVCTAAATRDISDIAALRDADAPPS